MTELEWLKQESGLTDEEIKGLEAVGGFAKLRTGLMKVLGLSEQALKDKVEAENQRLSFEKRYNDEFVPEMRKVTQDALRAQAEAAAANAKLAKAREYGIVPEDTTPAAPPADPNAPPRAPGSPDPNLITRDDFGRFSQSQSNVIITLNDLNAEHFKLFGTPLGETQALVDEATRQRTLGNKNYSLKQAWEAKYNVQAKRDEIAKAERQKEIDAAVAADRKAQAEKNGANPNMRSGRPSKFATYQQSDATKEPWKAPRQKSQSNKPWRDKALAVVREFAA